jgi:hypothetical protein
LRRPDVSPEMLRARDAPRREGQHTIAQVGVKIRTERRGRRGVAAGEEQDNLALARGERHLHRAETGIREARLHASILAPPWCLPPEISPRVIEGVAPVRGGALPGGPRFATHARSPRGGGYCLSCLTRTTG